MLTGVMQWHAPPAKPLAKKRATVTTALTGKAIASENINLFIRRHTLYESSEAI